MPIEFRCSQCNQLLRVPEDASGKNARCPKCQALMTVPGASALSSGSLPLPSDAGAASPTPPIPGMLPGPPPPVSNPFGSGAFAAAPPPPKPAGESPFAGGGGHFADPPASLNPYASPSAASLMPMQYSAADVPINPRPVAADMIFNYAWQIWKKNLGLLVGVTFTFFLIVYGLAFAFGGLEEVLKQQGEDGAAIGVHSIGSLLGNFLQMFLGIGLAQINLKLARNQNASFGDLFGGIGLFWPILGSSILAGLALLLGALCLIVPAILMMLAYWPYYYLIVDRKTGVMDSFTLASQITTGNWGSSFVLWLMSVGIFLLGCGAVCIGLLFAAPLVSMMFAVAYLMMSGQLEPYPNPAYSSYPPAEMK